MKQEGDTTMPLHFRNDTGKTIWLAIGYSDNNCTNNPWRKEGWWKIDPRSNVTVYTGPTKNRYFYYYAYTTNHENVWNGNYQVDLPSHVFSRCWSEPGGERVGMKELRATADDYTMELYI